MKPSSEQNYYLLVLFDFFSSLAAGFGAIWLLQKIASESEPIIIEAYVLPIVLLAGLGVVIAAALGFIQPSLVAIFGISLLAGLLLVGLL